MSRTHRALVMLALSLAVATATTAAAAAAPAPAAAIEDQNDRLLRNQLAAQAERTQAAVVLARSMERNQPGNQAVPERGLLAQRRALYESELAYNLAVAPAASAPIRPAAPGALAAPGPGVDVLATLLLGLVGGLVGGGAVIGGWIVASRRRVHRAAAAT